MSQAVPYGCSSSAATEMPVTLSKGIQQKRLTLEFLYLDLNVCAPCRATEANLEEALAEVAGLLKAVGVEVSVDKIQVHSLEQALALDFFSSPTLRVNGVDIQLESKESHCSTCSTISGTEIDCRMWSYQGQEYEAPPKAMIVDALLRAVCDSPGTRRPPKVPISDSARANLKRFFNAKQRNTPATETGVKTNPGTCCSGGGCCRS